MIIFFAECLLKWQVRELVLCLQSERLLKAMLNIELIMYDIYYPHHLKYKHLNDFVFYIGWSTFTIRS